MVAPEQLAHPRWPARSDLQILPIPVNEIAQQQGSTRVANVVDARRLPRPHPDGAKASIIAAIEDVLGPGKQHLLAINLNALEAGLAFASHVPVQSP